jgi:predicted anti-sigma-YlaC factor YlaD
MNMDTHPERLIAREADACALDAGERRELQAHLEVCTACREALESQRTVARLLRARAAVQPRPGFSALVSARIDRENGDGFLAVANWRAWTVGLAPVAAALVLMAYLGVGAASATSTDAAVTFETWASANSASTPAAVFLQPSASGDQLLEAVLTGAVPSSSGESPDVR